RGVEEAALALGVAALLDRPTHELSGGELQRVALAAALAGRPALAVLDEPTSQLDPVAGDELLSLLRRLNEQWDTAILLADHRLDRALPAADRVLALARARGARGTDGAAPAAPRRLLPARPHRRRRGARGARRRRPRRARRPPPARPLRRGAPAPRARPGGGRSGAPRSCARGRGPG